MKKKLTILTLLFGFLLFLLVPIFAQAIEAPEAAEENRFFIGICPLIWALFFGVVMFFWVGWKSKGKIYRWMKKKLPPMA